MKRFFLTVATLAALSGAVSAQASDAIVALGLPEETVPIIALDEVNRGIRLTGESMLLKDVVRQIGVDAFENNARPTALIRRSNGRLGAYGGKSLSRIDEIYGGDGVVEPAPEITENTQRGLDTNSVETDAVPVIAMEEQKGGIRLTGEYVSRNELESSMGSERLAQWGPPTALGADQMANWQLITCHWVELTRYLVGMESLATRPMALTRSHAESRY